MPMTLYRYLAKELMLPFLLGTAIFTGVLLMGRMLRIAELVVSKGVTFSELFRLIIYLLPNFALITIPMSLLLAVLLASCSSGSSGPSSPADVRYAYVLMGPGGVAVARAITVAPT